MTLNISKPYTVNGFKYRDLEEDFEDGTYNYIGAEVLTPNCGWTEDRICSKACNKACKNAQNLFDEVGIDY